MGGWDTFEYRALTGSLLLLGVLLPELHVPVARVSCSYEVWPLVARNHTPNQVPGSCN